MSQMKKAILVVSFGTSVPATRQANIDALENDLREHFPGWEVRRAFTSGMVRAKIAAEEGLQMLRKAGDETGLKVVTEIVDVNAVDLICKYADVLQVGARNMQNFQLLKAVGKAKKPVLLKRGLSATITEWLNAAEYIMSEGNDDVIFCERGIRTYETFTRNTLDLSAVAAIKELSHLPVIVDPSHGTGRWQMVRPMARAAIAAGADGLMIEVHPHPEMALSDGDQSLTPENFRELMDEVHRIAAVMGRA